MIPQHLATLIQAAKQVSPQLVSNSRIIDEEKKIDYLGERTFAYELYRQWQNLMDSGVDNLVINAEIEKKCVKEKEFLSKLVDIFGLTNDGKPHRCFYPDLVCHNSQFTSDNPEVICEIKTKKGININTKLLQDFKKLASYMTYGVLLHNPFKVGVFILVGGNFTDITFASETIIENKKDDIYCMTYNVRKNDDGEFVPDIQCKCLKEINYN